MVVERLGMVQADITTLQVDAIVNAANESLSPGGGVCGAIHRAAGPGLQRECAALGGCPTGQARVTAGHALPARWVVHAVGPVWRGGGHGEARLLADCYRHALALAAEKQCRSVAFPAISTGTFGYPPDEAAEIATATVACALAAHPHIEKVLFCAFDDASAATLRAALAHRVHEELDGS